MPQPKWRSASDGARHEPRGPRARLAIADSAAAAASPRRPARTGRSSTRAAHPRSVDVDVCRLRLILRPHPNPTIAPRSIRCALLLAAAAPAVEYDVVLLGEQTAAAVVAFRWRHDDRTPLAELAETFCAAAAQDDTRAAAASPARRGRSGRCMRSRRPARGRRGAGDADGDDLAARSKALATGRRPRGCRPCCSRPRRSCMEAPNAAAPPRVLGRGRRRVRRGAFDDADVAFAYVMLKRRAARATDNTARRRPRRRARRRGGRARAPQRRRRPRSGARARAAQRRRRGRGRRGGRGGRRAARAALARALVALAPAAAGARARSRRGRVRVDSDRRVLDAYALVAAGRHAEAERAAAAAVGRARRARRRRRRRRRVERRGGAARCQAPRRSRFVTARPRGRRGARSALGGRARGGRRARASRRGGAKRYADPRGGARAARPCARGRRRARAASATPRSRSRARTRRARSRHRSRGLF